MSTEIDRRLRALKAEQVKAEQEAAERAVQGHTWLKELHDQLRKTDVLTEIAGQVRIDTILHPNGILALNFYGRGAIGEYTPKGETISYRTPGLDIDEDGEQEQRCCNITTREDLLNHVVALIYLHIKAFIPAPSNRPTPRPRISTIA